MFEIKKIVSSFLLPPGILITICLIAYFYLRKRLYRYSFIFLYVAFLVYLFSSSFIWKFLICKIEGRVYRNISLDGDVIAVFGGGVSSFDDYITKTNSLDYFSSDRVFTGYRLHLKTHLPIILTGGRVFNQEAFSEVVKKLLVSMGVDERYILVDNISKDTFENVEMIKKIAKENNYRRVIIVSDAMHTPRIYLLFKKNNLDASFYPSKYLCSNPSWKDILPGDMLYSRIFFYEFLGYLYYSLAH